MKFGVLVFPGSNCDHDTFNVIAEVAHQPVTFLWHDSEDLAGVDAVLVPGGFAYGDYLRTGAIARFSPVRQSVKRFAAGGGLVLGICNGFQILTEAGLLPGALMRNAGLKYICKQVHLRVETADSPFTSALSKGDVLTRDDGTVPDLVVLTELMLPDLIESLLRDRVPPEPFAAVRRTVEEDLGKPLAEVFTSFDRVPIASAIAGIT